MDVDEIVKGIEERAQASHDYDHIFLIESGNTIAKVANTVLGFLVVMFLFLYPFIVVAEISYIFFPIIRTSTDKLLIHFDGKGVPNAVLGFALRDAKKAIELCETGDSSSPVLMKYLMIKFSSLNFAMFIIAMVCVGSNSVVAFISELVSGIIKLFIPSN